MAEEGFGLLKVLHETVGKLEPAAENLAPWKEHPKNQQHWCPTPPPCLGTTGHQGDHHPIRSRRRVMSGGWGDDLTKAESTSREHSGAI